MIKLLPSQIVSLFTTERTRPPLGNPYPIQRHIPFSSLKHPGCLVRSWCDHWLSVPPSLSRAYLRNSHSDKIHISFILEIKNAIWEIKLNKFWKSEVSFEKTNDSLKIEHLLKESNGFKRGNFGNQKYSWQIKRVKFWKSNISWKIKMKHLKPKIHFSLIKEKISKSTKTRQESK